MSKEITIDVDVEKIDGNYVFTSPEVDTFFVNDTNYDQGADCCKELLDYVKRHLPDQIPDADEDSEIKLNIRRVTTPRNDTIKQYKKFKEMDIIINESDDDED